MNDDFALIWNRIAADHGTTAQEVREEIRLALSHSPIGDALSPEEAVSLSALAAMLRLADFA